MSGSEEDDCAPRPIPLLAELGPRFWEPQGGSRDYWASDLWCFHLGDDFEYGVLVAALCRNIAAGDIEHPADLVWMDYCGRFDPDRAPTPGECGALVELLAPGEAIPSYRFLALLAALRQKGGRRLLRELVTQPNCETKFYGPWADGNEVDDLELAYPRPRQGTWKCACRLQPCVACANPYETSVFIRPASSYERYCKFEAFCKKEQRAFLDLCPRWLLEWCLEAWRYEERFDAAFMQYDRDLTAADIERCRRRLYARAEESLRWESSERPCRKAWAAAVARAAKLRG